MTVMIDGREYEAVTTAVTALRFRAKYNKSCMSKDFSEEDSFNLMYISIEDENKPCYHDFMALCGKNKYSYRMAIAVYEDIMRKDEMSIIPETVNVDEAGSLPESLADFDEFQAMAIFSLAGLPTFLWHELSLMQIMSITNATFKLKNGVEKPKELTYEETARMYCIDEATESKIQEYLDANPELIAEENEENGIL